jgi:hypothetical protein
VFQNLFITHEYFYLYMKQSGNDIQCMITRKTLIQWGNLGQYFTTSIMKVESIWLNSIVALNYFLIFSLIFNIFFYTCIKEIMNIFYL